jgi:hypothetical protein
MFSNARRFGGAFTSFWRSGFGAKLFTTISLLLMLVPMTQAQDDGQNKRGWDVENSDPPPLGNPREVKPMVPTNIKPFAFLFYQSCEPMGDSLGYTGKWSFDILSHYASVGFEHSVSDSLVVLRLRARRGVAHEAQIWFPKKPFTLRVILGVDTAVFRMDLTAGTFVYVDTSSLLWVEEPKEIPANLVTMQFMDRDNEQARDLVEQVSAEFGSAVKQIVLSEGFYPCLSVPGVQRTNIGRKRVLNETELGLLVCFQVVDQSQMAVVSEWIGEQQIEEFKRVVSQFGMKGR